MRSAYQERQVEAVLDGISRKEKSKARIEVESSPCLIASASATRAGNVIEIKLA